MSLSSHLAELRRKHANLEQKIEMEMRSPAADELQISKLKREKLRLKDEISRLGEAETIH
ncbi:YdcH family protein [Pikeienuella sp. HZG-20]|uniref:YdcH family protein n=1 Tax=Paludibacillus litoralis TaxID=3133267 RepID=UPI0030ED37BE